MSLSNEEVERVRGLLRADVKWMRTGESMRQKDRYLRDTADDIDALLSSHADLEAQLADTNAHWGEASRQLKEAQAATEAAEAENARLKTQVGSLREGLQWIADGGPARWISIHAVCNYARALLHEGEK